MIVGLGIDLVEIDRIRRSLERFGPRFLDRLLTRSERDRLPLADPAHTVAGLFAAKEAASKALGTGIACGVTFHSLEILRPASGPPRLTLHGPAKDRAEALGAARALVSITHGRDSAAAVVVLES